MKRKIPSLRLLMRYSEPRYWLLPSPTFCDTKRPPFRCPTPASFVIYHNGCYSTRVPYPLVPSCDRDRYRRSGFLCPMGRQHSGMRPAR